MPRVVVSFSPVEEESLAETLMRSCVDRLLGQYVGINESGSDVSDSMTSTVVKEVTKVVREEARNASGGIAKIMLQGRIPTYDTFGSPTGEKLLAEIIADEVKRSLSGNRSSILQEMIRNEVSMQLKRDLKAAVDEAKAVVVDALLKEATEALRGAVSAALPAVKL